MGGEFGQWKEWNHDTSLDWHLLERAPGTRGVQLWVRDLNRLYAARARAPRARLRPARVRVDRLQRRRPQRRVARAAGQDARRERVVAVFNFTPVPRHGYRVGVTGRSGLDGDRQQRRRRVYGGSGVGNLGRAVALAVAGPRPLAQPRADAAAPRGAVFLKPVLAGGRPARRPTETEAVVTDDEIERPLDVILTAVQSDGPLRLHPRALLPAAAREPVARGDRGAGLAPTRTTTGTSASPPSATRPTPRADPRRREPDRRASSTTTRDQLQLRPDAAVLARGQAARRLRARSSRPTATSRARFAGHGSALAQAVQPHDPAARQRRATRRTQVLWGIRDFEHRFGRPPEGMWLPETAVDTETLEVLAGAGIRFTILAPHQASRVRVRRRRLGRRPGEPASTRRAPYRVAAAVGPLDRGLLLRRPDLARGRLRAVCWPAASSSPSACMARLRRRARAEPQLVHIATDGETYGHHHRHGDMALAYALRTSSESGARAPDELRRVPRAAPADRRGPDRREHVVELRPRRRALAERLRLPDGRAPGLEPGAGARRCARRSTGCATRSRPLYEEAAGALFRDPWAARDDYIDVILDRSPENVAPFPRGATPARALDGARAHPRPQAPRDAAARPAHVHELRLVLRRHRRHRGRARSSQYAGRALQLSRRLFPDVDLETPFLETLSKAKSNVPEAGDGRPRLRGLASAPRASRSSRVGGALRRVLPFHRVRRHARRSTAIASIGRTRSGSRAAARGSRSGARPGHLGDHRGVASGSSSASSIWGTTTSRAA